MGPEWGPLPENLSVWRDTWILISENVSSEREMVWQPHREGVVVYGAAISAWILAVNLVLLVVLCRQGPGSRQGLWLLKNLLLAQFLTGVLVVPWNVRTEAVGGWTFGLPACRAWLLGRVGLSALCTWSVFVITLERLIYAADPRLYARRMTSCRAAGLLLLSWIAAFGACCPALWRMIVDEEFVLPEVCAVAVERHYALVFSTSAFLLPAVLSLILSTSLVLLVLCTGSRHSMMTEDGEDAQTQPCCPDKEECHEEDSFDSTTGNAATTALALTACQVAMWTPFYVLSLMIPFCQTLCVDPTLWSLCEWLGYTSAGVAPLLIFLDSRLRHRFRALISCRRKDACYHEKCASADWRPEEQKEALKSQILTE